MKFNRIIIQLFFCLLVQAYTSEAIQSPVLESNHYKIGLLVVATGKYIRFVDPLIESAKKYFCTKHDVTFFVFTDGLLDQTSDVVRIEEKRLEWPFSTMMRFVMYDRHHELLESMDYLFACDADMLFIGSVGDEILHDRVGTLSPGFVGTRGTYETRSISTACIDNHEGKYYFAGGFCGGASQDFLKMSHVMTQNIETDLKKDIVAVWHDESHLNRYFATHEPTILSPLYCYPECWRERHPDRWAADYPFVKLLNINKDCAQMRT